MSRTANKVFTHAGDVAALEHWVSKLAVNAHVRICTHDGVAVQGIVAVTPTVQVFRDADGVEGMNGVVKLEDAQRPDWDGLVWLGDIDDVQHLDSVRAGVSKAVATSGWIRSIMRTPIVWLGVIASLCWLSKPPVFAQENSPPTAPAMNDGQVFEVASTVGAQRVLYLTPAVPLATLVMLPGGSGDVGIERNGKLAHSDNFVVRTRTRWLQLGYAVLIPDAFDHQNLRGARSSLRYATLVEALIQAAHAKSSAPVFLLGTSQGSIAAMNGASHATAGSINGLVLTESVSIPGASHETVFDAAPGDVRVPALIVANTDDQCAVAAPQEAPRIASAMLQSPHVTVMYVGGGVKRSSDNCGSLTPHGYYGIEASVVEQIARWLQAHVGQRARA